MDMISKELEPEVKGQETPAQPAENVLVDGSFQWNYEQLVDQIWRDMGGAASRSQIRKVLIKSAPVYENVRVKTFVPILLRRDILRQLEDELKLRSSK